MKRVSAFLAAAFVLLTLASCGLLRARGGESEKDGNSDPELSFNGETIKLTYETNHRDLHYKENLVSMERDTAGSVRRIVYRQNGDVTFTIWMVYFADKSIAEVMAESDYVYTTKTADGLEYTYFEYDDNGLPGHTYVHEYDGTTYTISFVSQYDMTSLESVFMGCVYFAHE